MKSIVITNESEPIQIVEKEELLPNANQVVVKLKAAALNRRDQWIREGKYPGIQLGTTLGSDGAGIIEQLGADVASEWLGKEVVINPNNNWGNNPSAQSSDYHILGMPTDGTLAEYVLVDVDRLHLKPTHLSWEEAAALPLGGLTAYRAAFHYGDVKTGKKVLISGAGGGVAQFAFQFCVAAGAEVFVTSGDEAKIEKCLELGAQAGFNYKKEGWQNTALESSGGFDVVIDSAGGDQLNSFIKLMRPAGKIVFYGATTGMPTKLDVYRMFWNQITIQGSTMGNDQEFTNMLGLVSSKGIKPIIDSVFPFNQSVAAFDRINSGVFGKVIVSI